MQKALAPFAVVLLAASFSAASDPELAKQRDAAITKGVDWLKKAQASDGSWDYADGPFRNGGNIGHMKQGCTALCALALMKAGIAPDDPIINKAFDFIQSCQLERTYEAGCVLMALEARINWELPVSDEGETTRDRGAVKKFKPSGKDNDLAKRCVDFLVKNQVENGGWSYPREEQQQDPQGGGTGGGGGRGGRSRMDLSNMQYALLGLEAGERIGIQVPKSCYEKAQGWLVANQEKEGPEVDPFPVPGADVTYKELKKIEKELHDKLKQIETEFKGKKEGETNAAGHTESDERRTTEEDAARKILKTTEKLPKPHARGWNYSGISQEEDQGQGGGTQGANPGGGGQGGGRRGGGGRGGFRRVTASMTTAGLACLFICKAHLDGQANYEKNLRGPIDKGLRDGAAWLARNFSVTQNGGEDNGAQGGGGGGGGRGGRGGARAGQLDYYLYGLERAGVLLLVPKFGEHDWYDEGCREFVKAQEPNGSWDAGDNGTVGPVCDTCFALLFLSRGTTPIVRIPTRTTTGAPPAKSP